MRYMVFVIIGILTLGALADNPFEPHHFDARKKLTERLDEVYIQGLDLRKTYDRPCQQACRALRYIFDNATVITSNKTPAFDVFTQSYWSSQQSDLDPACVFKPRTAEDVSIMILVSRVTLCPFAVKSGGHSQFAGASSIENGIAVSFEHMKEVSLASDKRTAAIGPGNDWYEAYSALEEYKVTVIGARMQQVGVGGAILGGGISFFSNMYGWACDNVASFEVVTACGSIVTASPNSYPDLYWALRGGGNNFGIVTKFTLYTYAQGKMYYSNFGFNNTVLDSVIRAFVGVGINPSHDPNGQQILQLRWDNGNRVALGQLQYAQEVEYPSMFLEYRSIPKYLSVANISSQADLVATWGRNTIRGLRQGFWTATYKLDTEFTSFVKDVFYEDGKVIENLPGVSMYATLQVITTQQIQHMSRHGGNPLGLRIEDGPLLNFLTVPQWDDPAYDSLIHSTIAKIFKRLNEQAKKKGLSHNLVYMNYASEYQDVIASYGPENKANLKKIAKKYDPKEVFQKLQPGFFKLEGAPKAPLL